MNVTMVDEEAAKDPQSHFTEIQIVQGCVDLIHHKWRRYASELDELMLDAPGILPQRKQHKKLLLVCAAHLSLTLLNILCSSLECVVLSHCDEKFSCPNLLFVNRWMID
ncbi:hypothetical protein Tco_1347317 [Tanacetum coccineum]